MNEPNNNDDGGPAFPGETGQFGYGYSKPVFAPDGDRQWIELNQGMSIRVYAAIHLRQPESGIPWLDAMIRKARQDNVQAQ